MWLLQLYLFHIHCCFNSIGFRAAMVLNFFSLIRQENHAVWKRISIGICGTLTFYLIVKIKMNLYSRKDDDVNLYKDIPNLEFHSRISVWKESSLQQRFFKQMKAARTRFEYTTKRLNTLKSCSLTYTPIHEAG